MATMSGSEQTLPAELYGPGAMGLAAYLALARLERDGLDASALFQKVDLSPSAVKERQRVNLASQIELLDHLSNLTGDAWIGVTLASEFDLRLIGMLYYIAASSPTLYDALKRLERYSALVSDVLQLKIEGRRLFFHYAVQAQQADRHQSEFLAMVLLRLCRHLVGDRQVALEVRFSHQRSGDLQPIHHALGCDVHFGFDRDQLVFDGALLSQPPVTSDPYLNELLSKVCDEAIAASGRHRSPFRKAIEDAVAPLLPHGRATAATVARGLGMSERTLARRLTDEGLSFQKLLDQLRRELAVHYLEQGLQVAQIAWLLGFKHPSSFTHACRRWTGRNPSELRRSRR